MKRGETTGLSYKETVKNLPGLLAGRVKSEEWRWRKTDEQITLPPRTTVGGFLLELIAVCGELPTDQLIRLPGGEHYKDNVIKELKRKRLIRTYYKNGLRGYRLTVSAKRFLLADVPCRFSFALSGSCETNHIKSELTKRLRLHRMAEITVSMQNAGVNIYRDEKTAVFSPEWNGDLPSVPAFYNSREVKELGTPFVKITGARSVGVLLTEDNAFVTYNLGNSLMKWEYKSEMRTKVLMQTVLCRERLPNFYQPDDMQGLIFGNSMELAFEILCASSVKQYFILDGNYEHFYYLTNDRYGERLLYLLCHKQENDKLKQLLLSDLSEGSSVYSIENDAFDARGDPVLFGYFCDLPRIRRFDTALSLQGRNGTLICFDFQKEAIARYCGGQVTFRTIDFAKYERRFFEK